MTAYVVPERKILRMFDLNPWFYSKAYTEYMAFIRTLNDSVRGVKTCDDIICGTNTLSAIDILQTIEDWIAEYPPEDMDQQRFGNKSYRKWHERLMSDGASLIEKLIGDDSKAAVIELFPYLAESFGNATRIDFGSGHEASFIVFCLCLYKIGFFTPADNKAVVLRVFTKYLRVCRRLQSVYHMEPAGSRGVHAIDDFHFAPFIWGSAQLIGNRRLTPDSYTRPTTVDAHAHESLFIEAVQCINQTKTGAFHEHSNQLWNISAVESWEKVNGGMFKMYEGEVLKKFPVVQHFVFGSLFSFDKREDAPREALVRQVDLHGDSTIVH